MNPEDETPRDRGRRLRAESTDEERKLWKHLGSKRLGGFKFRRQHRIGPYFTDFCCLTQRLIIELDGSQHAEREEERKDALRTAYLSRLSSDTVVERAGQHRNGECAGSNLRTTDDF